MDALSSVLANIRLHGTVYFERSFACPWGMKMPATPFAQFHAVRTGQVVFGGPGIKNAAFSAGSIVVLFRGREHWLSDPSLKNIQPGPDVLAAHHKGKDLIKALPEHSRLLCGHFEIDSPWPQELAGLPDYIILSPDKINMVPSLEYTLGAIAEELRAERPGRGAVIDRLAEILFIKILEVCAAESELSGSFLQAIRDPELASVLGHFHGRPAFEWTLANTAAAIGVSRTKLAVKFKEYLGQTPMEYLLRLRMRLAHKELRFSNKKVGEIARGIGYESESSFSRAFRRVFEQTPGQVRRDKSDNN